MIRTLTAALALTFAAAASAQDAPRYAAVFHLDAAGNVASAEGCEAGARFALDLSPFELTVDGTTVTMTDGDGHTAEWVDCATDAGALTCLWGLATPEPPSLGYHRFWAQAEIAAIRAAFQFDRAGAVVAMTGCEGEVCFPVDLTGVAVRVDPTTGRITLAVPADDGSTSSESWDDCHYDYGNNMSVCDEFVLPEPCNCSRPYGWDGDAPAM